MATTYDKASLVMIPSGYKDDKLYSIKPTDGSGDFTFSRDGAGASPATRVNASGLIEKGRENLFKYSEEFNQGSAWSLQGGAQISANAAVAPDGTNTADLLYPSIDGVVKAAIQQFTSSNGTPYAQSIYVKASGKNFAALYSLNGSSGTAMWVNLTTGDITDGGIGNTFGLFATSVGNGWWRIGFTDIGNGGLGYMHIYPTDAAGSDNVTANGTDGILLWGAQLEESLVATDYIETTTAPVSAGLLGDMPRLDYSGGATCPSLLLEPSRVNNLSHSEYVNGSPDVSNVTITSNASTSPEGVANASKVVPSASNTFHWFGEVFTGASSVYTQTIFAKADTYDHLFMVLRTDGGAKRYGVKFNLTTGTFVDDITFGSPTSTSYDIEDYGNGWYRCSVSSNHTTGTSVIALFGPSLDGNLTSINNEFAGDGTSGILVYGASCESGSYPTSYIPTYGSASTRGRDISTKTSVSSLIGQTEGTIFAEVQNIPNNDTAFLAPTLSDGTLNNSLYILRYTSGGIEYVEISVRSGGVLGVDQRIALSVADGDKFAFAYKQNDFVVYRNGVQILSDTSGNVAAMSNVYLGQNYNGSATTRGDFKQALLFPTRLTNAELAALTTI